MTPYCYFFMRYGTANVSLKTAGKPKKAWGLICVEAMFKEYGGSEIMYHTQCV